VYQLRAAVEGVVVAVPVDEGQLVAEEDVIAEVDTESGRRAIVTDVPGVVRELYVERGRFVARGTTVALIDEA
jgi:multidrug efflux pump subunit AcrA (membrane-fusion protein)